MRILKTPIGECLDMLEGEPYRIADFAIRKHAQGVECVAERLENVSFIMPPETTLIGARRFLTIFELGFRAGAQPPKSSVAPKSG